MYVNTNPTANQSQTPPTCQNPIKYSADGEWMSYYVGKVPQAVQASDVGYIVPSSASIPIVTNNIGAPTNRCRSIATRSSYITQLCVCRNSMVQVSLRTIQDAGNWIITDNSYPPDRMATPWGHECRYSTLSLPKMLYWSLLFRLTRTVFTMKKPQGWTLVAKSGYFRTYETISFRDVYKSQANNESSE